MQINIVRSNWWFYETEQMRIKRYNFHAEKQLNRRIRNGVG